VPHHLDGDSGLIKLSVHSWLLQIGKQKILIDACCGNNKSKPLRPFWHMLNTPYLERLAAAGARPEEIDLVMCTHLHHDHVGWNTQLRDGRWVPTFPNARYLFSRTENDYGDPRRNPAADADPQRSNAYRDSVLPVIETGQAVLLDGAYAIDDTMLVEPAPGHTVGHVVLKLVDQGERALFSGDAIHHALQVYVPNWNSCFCEIPDEARATRHRLLGDCAEHGALLFPIHFGAPHVATIAREGDAFKLRFVAGKSPLN
jgi:glyoxylase-like metal-dependent hydrolase (beta-lactamase superfamily II)